jgi:type IV secretory pathway VirB3-like protein
MLSLDVWLHRQLREQLWKGPTAVSAYLSLPMQLIGITLSALCLKALTGPTLCILSVSGLLCVLLVWIERMVSLRDHNLGLLQFSLSQTRHRIKAMGIRSAEIDRFAKRLCLDSRIAFKFRNSRFRSVELIIQKLDLLARTAERYGSGGRKVFSVNQEPIVDAIRLFEHLPLENVEEVIEQQLIAFLKSPPEFDPEGWALEVYRES